MGLHYPVIDGIPIMLVDEEILRRLHKRILLMRLKIEGATNNWANSRSRQEENAEGEIDASYRAKFPILAAICISQFSTHLPDTLFRTFPLPMEPEKGS